jgi:hypothetical protein
MRVYEPPAHHATAQHVEKLLWRWLWPLLHICFEHGGGRLGSSEVIEPLQDDAIDGPAIREALFDRLAHWLCTADGCLESCG